MKCERDLCKKKKMIKNMNSKMTTNSQVLKSEPKKYKNKNKLSKQLEQEQNHRNGDHMEGYRWGGGGERMGEKVQGIRSINGWYKIDRRIVWEMEKPKSYMYH